MMNSLLCGTIGAAAIIMSVSAPVSGRTVVVTPLTLKSAFASASGGDTLKLVGTFGNIRLQDRSFTSTVTLDSSHAVFIDSLILQHDSNVKLWRPMFTIASGSSYAAAVNVWGGNNIVVDRATIAGNGTEVGINFEGTNNATATNGSFDGLKVGITLGSGTGGTASYNRITHAVIDGIDIADSHNVMATHNICSLGTPGPGAHADCIQLWSLAGHALESDVTVTYNTAIGPTQGFTSFATGGGALRVAITHNTVTTSDPQGVACYDCIDSNISYNSVSTLPGAAHQTGISIIDGTNNIVVGNVIHARPPVSNSMFAPARSPAIDAVDRGGVNGSPGTVPEPATWVMLLTGFGAVGLARRRAARLPRLAA